MVISRAIYHGLAAATSRARADGYPHVTGVHVISAFIDDQGSVVARASGAMMTPSTLRRVLIASGAPDVAWPVDSQPVPLAPDVYDAVFDAERSCPVPSTGHVLIRLLADPCSPTCGHLASLGIDPRELAVRTAALLDNGDHDQS